MKTTIDLPDDLVRQLKLKAAREGRKLKDVAAEALRRSLAAEADEPSEKALRSKLEQPLFSCDETRASVSGMTLQALLELERQAQEEEDVRRVSSSF